jgi:hypothetical protein
MDVEVCVRNGSGRYDCAGWDVDVDVGFDGVH